MIVGRSQDIDEQTALMAERNDTYIETAGARRVAAFMILLFSVRSLTTYGRKLYPIYRPEIIIFVFIGCPRLYTTCASLPVSLKPEPEVGL